jgi:hypothetical protein
MLHSAQCAAGYEDERPEWAHGVIGFARFLVPEGLLRLAQMIWNGRVHSALEVARPEDEAGLTRLSGKGVIEGERGEAGRMSAITLR